MTTPDQVIAMIRPMVALILETDNGPYVTIPKHILVNALAALEAAEAERDALRHDVERYVAIAAELANSPAALQSAADTPAPSPPQSQMMGEEPLDKKLAGVIRKLHALHHAFDMKGTNSVTMLRAINTLSVMQRNATPAPQPNLGGSSLDERMKAAGMFTVAEMMGVTPLTKWKVQVGMTDLDTFSAWLDRKVSEYLTMKAAYDLGDKDESDELYEWVLAHAGAYSSIRENFRAALASTATEGQAE